MAQFSTIAEMTSAAESGAIVCWKNESYRVSKSLWGEWYITWEPWSKTPYTVALFWNDGVTCDYSPQDFYIKEDS